MIKGLLARASRGGRLESLGQDFDRGHRTYVSQLEPGGLLWLRTKPFSAPPNEELARSLFTFAHIVERLGLGLRAQVLDVGCGPGWMSEFFARCGYWVTGVDISEEMVEIARERVAAIDGPVGEGIEPLAEFHALPVREMPWTARFDAAILYDTMHHFDDELETLRVIRRTLVPGGQLYIHEGARPEPGSAGERQLIAEMEQYGTLEAPFDPAYLVSVVREAGFTNVQRLLEVDELVEVPESGPRPSGLRRLFRRFDGPALAQLGPETNTLHALNPVPAYTEGGKEGFAGELAVGGEWQHAPDGEHLVLPLWVTNTGQGFWPVWHDFPFPRGVVTVGAYVEAAEGERLELPRMTFPRSVSPGDSLGVALRVPRAEVAGHETLYVDLVREGIAWFGELGSEPLAVPLPRD